MEDWGVEPEGLSLEPEVLTTLPRPPPRSLRSLFWSRTDCENGGSHETVSEEARYFHFQEARPSNRVLFRGSSSRCLSLYTHSTHLKLNGRYRGITAPAMQEPIKRSAKFTCNQFYNKILIGDNAQQAVTPPSTMLWKKMACGYLAGASETTFISPFEVTK